MIQIWVKRHRPQATIVCTSYELAFVCTERQFYDHLQWMVSLRSSAQTVIRFRHSALALNYSSTMTQTSTKRQPFFYDIAPNALYRVLWDQKTKPMSEALQTSNKDRLHQLWVSLRLHWTPVYDRLHWAVILLSHAWMIYPYPSTLMISPWSKVISVIV